MDEQLDGLAFRFFKLFARYESELKTQGFFAVSKSGTIVVDWDRFANERVGPNFLADLGVNSGAARYILDHPPKKQAVDEHGQIVWAAVSNKDQSVQALFGHLSRIRNNLFHGAKFNGTWFDPERSQSLLGHGLRVLEQFQHRAGL